MRDIPINRIMTTSPATIGPNDPASMARKLLDSGDIHHLPVIENGKLEGIISSADLLKLYLLDGCAIDMLNADATVCQIMESDPVVLESGASLRDAANMLAIGGYHAAPVIEPDRTLVGIVTTGDLINHLLNEIPRGDGSILSQAKSDSDIHLNDSEISSVLRDAEEVVEGGGELGALSQALIFLRDRNRLLQYACQAAELYIRSGHAEHEHSVLVKRLADVQTSSHSVIV
jgi:CBS domain-containing protein